MALGFFLGRRLRGRDGSLLERNGPRWYGSPARIGSSALTALCGLHLAFLPGLSRAFGISFLALEADPSTADPGLAANLFLGGALAGAPALTAGFLWGILPGFRSARWAGLTASGAALGTALWTGGGERLTTGLPVADLVLYAGAAALLAFRPLAADREREELLDRAGFGISLSGNRRVALALILGTGALAAGLLFSTLFRVLLDLDGGSGTRGAACLLAAAGGGLVLAGSPRRRGSWRAFGFGLALAGLAGLVVAGLVDSLPAAYSVAVGRLGSAAAGDMAGRILIAFLPLAGPAFFSGLALASAASLRGGSIRIPWLALCSVAGILAAPDMAEWVGSWGTLLAAGTLLAGAGCLLTLLEAGALVGRGLWTLAILAACAVVLLDAEAWDPRRLAMTPMQRPATGVGSPESRSGGGERAGRTLVRREGGLRSASLVLERGRHPALVAGGRARSVATFQARLADALAGHLPALLGPGGGRTLLTAPPTGTTWQALQAHDSFDITVAAPEPAVASVFIMAGRLRDLDALPGEPESLRLVRAGPRRLLARPGEPFDVILAPPAVGESDLLRFIGPRTLSLAGDRLREGGILVLSLPLKGISTEGLRSVAALFARRMPGAGAWRAGEELILVGGDRVVAGPDLVLVGQRIQYPGTRAALLELGLDDPLKILALHVAPVEILAGAAGEWDGAAFGAAVDSARLRSPYSRNLRWLAAYLGSGEPALHLPPVFTEEARTAARRRVAVLRGVHRRILLARAALEEGDAATSERLAAEAQRMDPSDREAALILSEALTRGAAEALLRGAVEEAEAGYARALASDPGSVEALTALSHLRYTEGYRQEATELLERAIGRSPWASELHRRLGLIRLEEEDLAGAREALLAAYDLDPARADTLYLLGEVARKRGDEAGARDLYDRALVRGGDSASVLSAMARMEMEAGDLDAALVSLNRALDSKPGDPEALILRARVHLRQGDREEARRDLLAAVATGGSPYRARAMLDAPLRNLLLGAGGGEE